MRCLTADLTCETELSRCGSIPNRSERRSGGTPVSQISAYENWILPKTTNPIKVEDLPVFLENIGNGLNDEFDVSFYISVYSEVCYKYIILPHTIVYIVDSN